MGLVVGDQVDKYEPKGISRNKEREVERQKRGQLRRAERAMRVFIPVTDFIAEQAKFYVGCRFTAGRLYPRTMKDTNIFFYPEFWSGIDKDLPNKERRRALNVACKQRAAINKSAPERVRAPLTNSEVEKAIAASATRSEHLTSLIVPL